MEKKKKNPKEINRNRDVGAHNSDGFNDKCINNLEMFLEQIQDSDLSVKKMART